MKNILIIFSLVGLIIFSSCTDLEEEIRDNTLAQDVSPEDIQSLLQGAYNGLRNPLLNQEGWWGLETLTSDEAIPPTRGGDWDDGGVWRQLHLHTWTEENPRVNSTFTELLSIVFRTSNILASQPNAQQAAEARFLRAFAMFQIADGWDQVPFRDGETLNNLLLAPNVVNGQEALDFVISECNEIINDLPEGPAHVANKDATRTLLMKAYLNRGAFANRENPSFDNGDMQQVISLGNDIINSGKYQLASNYYDNFAVANADISTENIFTLESQRGVSSAPIFFRWFSTMHYNQTNFGGGWNGFTTLSDFYDSFEDSDQRKGADYGTLFEDQGIRLGFMEGQQIGPDGQELLDRQGNPLAFTPEVSLIESGDNLEVTGIRVLKYEIDQENPLNTDQAGNQWAIYRYADVILMQAEAAMRSGDAGTGTNLFNELREARGASTLSTITLDDILAERGREFYWEGQRRTDLIRFGKFLDAWQEKPATGVERLLFPIPGPAIASNPNLVQNPGY